MNNLRVAIDMNPSAPNTSACTYFLRKKITLTCLWYHYENQKINNDSISLYQDLFHFSQFSS